MTASNNRESPCLSCNRVRDPKNCENKLCRDWQAWFIDRWEAMRRHVAKSVQGEGFRGATITVGGTEYHHPEHIRKYLSVDPCRKCTWRAGLCLGTCETKQAWTVAKERIDELESRSKRET